MLASELGREPLSDYTAVFCVNLKAPGATWPSGCGATSRRGGNLVWICGENVKPDEYNRMNEEAKRQLLPAKLLDVRAADPAQGKDSWNITYLDKKHPALRQLNDPPSLYQSVLVYKHVRIDAKRGRPGRLGPARRRRAAVGRAAGGTGQGGDAGHQRARRLEQLPPAAPVPAACWPA